MDFLLCKNTLISLQGYHSLMILTLYSTLTPPSRDINNQHEDSRNKFPSHQSTFSPAFNSSTGELESAGDAGDIYRSQAEPNVIQIDPNNYSNYSEYYEKFDLPHVISREINDSQEIDEEDGGKSSDMTEGSSSKDKSLSRGGHETETSQNLTTNKKFQRRQFPGKY